MSIRLELGFHEFVIPLGFGLHLQVSDIVETKLLSGQFVPVKPSNSFDIIYVDDDIVDSILIGAVGGVLFTVVNSFLIDCIYII